MRWSLQRQECTLPIDHMKCLRILALVFFASSAPFSSVSIMHHSIAAVRLLLAALPLALSSPQILPPFQLSNSTELSVGPTDIPETFEPAATYEPVSDPFPTVTIPLDPIFIDPLLPPLAGPDFPFPDVAPEAPSVSIQTFLAIVQPLLDLISELSPENQALVRPLASELLPFQLERRDAATPSFNNQDLRALAQRLLDTTITILSELDSNIDKRQELALPTDASKLKPILYNIIKAALSILATVPKDNATAALRLENSLLQKRQGLDITDQLASTAVNPLVDAIQPVDDDVISDASFVDPAFNPLTTSSGPGLLTAADLGLDDLPEDSTDASPFDPVTVDAVPVDSNDFEPLPEEPSAVDPSILMDTMAPEPAPAVEPLPIEPASIEPLSVDPTESLPIVPTLPSPIFSNTTPSDTVVTDSVPEEEPPFILIPAPFPHDALPLPVDTPVGAASIMAAAPNNTNSSTTSPAPYSNEAQLNLVTQLLSIVYRILQFNSNTSAGLIKKRETAGLPWAGSGSSRFADPTVLDLLARVIASQINTSGSVSVGVSVGAGLGLPSLGKRDASAEAATDALLRFYTSLASGQESIEDVSASIKEYIEQLNAPTQAALLDILQPIPARLELMKRGGKHGKKEHDYSGVPHGKYFIVYYTAEFHFFFPILSSLNPTLAQGLSDILTDPNIAVPDPGSLGMDSLPDQLKQFVLDTYVFLQIISDSSVSTSDKVQILEGLFEGIEPTSGPPTRLMRRGLRNRQFDEGPTLDDASKLGPSALHYILGDAGTLDPMGQNSQVPEYQLPGPGYAPQSSPYTYDYDSAGEDAVDSFESEVSPDYEDDDETPSQADWAKPNPYRGKHTVPQYVKDVIEDVYGGEWNTNAHDDECAVKHYVRPLTVKVVMSSS